MKEQEGKEIELEATEKQESSQNDGCTIIARKENAFLKFFKINERNTTFAREIIAGIMVFLSMIYILPVNTAILGDAAGDGLKMGIFASTALVSFICTFIMGLAANYPVMLSAGMGLNATIAYNVCIGMGYDYQSAMALVLIAGILFFLMSITPIRSMIINAIPTSFKKIISAGLGFFICLVGLKGSGIIQKNDSTIVALGNLKSPSVLLAIFGVLLVFALSACKNKYVKRFSILISMIVVAIVGLVLNYGFKIEDTGLPSIDLSNGWVAFSGLKDIFGAIYNDNLGNAFLSVLKNGNSYAVMFILIFVNLFDTTATLVSIGQDAGFMDENGQLIGGKKAMLADAAGAVISGPFGVSPVTSFAESAVGIEVGARTGLSACVTGLLFVLSLLVYPIFSIFSSYSITALALVSVGASIVSGNLKDIDWNDKIVGVTGFVTIIMITLTYSLSDGIGFGFILYTIMTLIAGKAKKEEIPLYIVSLFFIANFVLKAIVLS